MTQARALLASAAAIALTFGVTGQTMSPVETEKPLSTNDILIVTNDTAAEPGQTDEGTEGSAKMGQQDGTQQADNLGAAPESDTAKIDQSAPTTGTDSDAQSGGQ
jgi:hypothetical protein